MTGDWRLSSRDSQWKRAAEGSSNRRQQQQQQKLAKVQEGGSEGRCKERALVRNKAQHAGL